MVESDRTYRIRTVLAKMEGPYRDTVIMRPPMTPVVSNGKTVGFAHVFPENGLLMADIALDYATEERLIIETRSNKLYARIDAKPHFGGLYSMDLDTYTSLLCFDVLPNIIQLDIDKVVLHQTAAYSGQVPLGFVG